MKKWFVLLLALVMLISSCSNSAETGTEKEDAGEEPAEMETTGVNEYGWDVPKETLKITFYAGYGDQAEADELAKPMAEFYKEKFNVEIKKTVYSVEMVEKLNLMLASGDYPEVITFMDDELAEKFIAQGRAVDLTELIDKYAPNVKDKLGKYLNLMKTDDGKIYKLPVMWGENPNVAGWDFAVRYDWWKEIGSPVYQTPEEYYQTLKKIMEKHPTNADGEKIYALSDNTQGSGLYGAMLSAYGFKNGYKVNESTGEFTHWMNTPEGLEIARYINRFYREGMLDPDFLNNKFEDWQAKVMNERIIGNIGTWWHVWVAGQEAWSQQEGSNFNIEKRFMNVTVKDPNVDQATDVSSNFIGNSRVIITDKAKNPEQIMKWFNWELSGIGTMITGFGKPDPNNVWDIKDGQWIFSESAKDYAKKNENFHAVREKYGAQAYWMVAPAGWLKDEHLDPSVTRVSVWDMWPVDSDGKFLDKGVNLSWANVQGKSWDSTLYTVSFKADNPITNVNQTIKDTLLSEWAKMITSGSEAELEKNFNAAQNKLNELGLHDLEKFVAESYKENLEKFNME
ncbi:extracellular solute-binding protein [Paenibacillus alkalitolerans]|uniref:extracellular solute-binding protein n=1 Tax=Paenibacillus alkalitolerans TaxID=2799335 RepID=UPI0018F49CC3|nr:extracellular solute-binding protein [Paenibacillus alkalitolerans]